MSVIKKRKNLVKYNNNALKFDTTANWIAIKCVFQCALHTILTISVYPLKYFECLPYSSKLVVSVHYSLVEIKFNQMSITPLNTIIVIIIMKTAPSANQLKQKRKMHFHPPFKIRSVLLGVCVCGCHYSFAHWNHIICVWVSNKAVKRYIQAPTKMFFFLLYDWKVCIL